MVRWKRSRKIILITRVRPPNVILALVVRSLHGIVQDIVCKGGVAIIPFTRTTLFSVLDDDHTAVAFAYFFLSQEMPHVTPKLESRWEEIIRPAIDLITQGKFLQKWEETNPWTAKNIAGMRESVYAIDNKDKSFA